MPKTRPPYSPEFRRQRVDLVRAGRSPEDLSREFEPTAQSISNWVVQSDRQEGERPRSEGAGRRKAKGWPWPSVTGWPGCGARTSSSGWSATSSLELRPGSRGRPEPCRPGLPVHGREPGHLPDRGHGGAAQGSACAACGKAAEVRVLGVSESGFHAWRQPLAPWSLARPLLTRWRMLRSSSGYGRSTPVRARRMARRACTPSCGPEGRSTVANASHA